MNKIKGDGHHVVDGSGESSRGNKSALPRLSHELDLTAAGIIARLPEPIISDIYFRDGQSLCYKEFERQYSSPGSSIWLI